MFSSGFLSSGFTGFWGVLVLLVLLVLLSIFLTPLCSDCNRRSFQLQESRAESGPSTLVSVVKLEEARENPMIEQIQSDEREFSPDEGKQVSVSVSRNQQVDPQSTADSASEDEVVVPYVPWRSHLVEPASADGSSPDSSHIHNDIMNGWAQDRRATPPTSPGHIPEGKKGEEPAPPVEE